MRLTMLCVGVGENLWYGKTSERGTELQRARHSTADLRQRAQTADFHLQQRVLLRLVGERLTEERLQRLAFAQRIAQQHLMIAEETRTKPAISGQTDTI